MKNNKRYKHARRGLFLLGLTLSIMVGNVAYAGNPLNGAGIYVLHCQRCHGSGGQSVMPGMPNFTRGEGLLQPDDNLVSTIRAGRGIMPAYNGLLEYDEILDVIAYIRTLR